MDIYERKLMLVDDNQELLEMIADILRHSGYKNIVKAKCVQEALTVFQMEKPDMAVLDVMLPDGDGFQLFQKLRENSEIPILFLSARDEDRDRLFGLGLGADDYITKPFSLKLILMRIEAVLRRVKEYEEKQKDMIQYRNIQLDSVSHTVYAEGTPVALTNIEYCLLELFLKNQGRVFTRDNLLNQVWGYDFVGDEKTVNIHIMNLRRKLGVDLIETIRGVGYRIGKEDKK